MSVMPSPDEGISFATPHEAAPESCPKPGRRRFSDDYKLRVLEEIDACTEPGQISALLRREKLYSSYLVEWRQMRARGELGGRPRPLGERPTDAKLVDIERENRELQERLRQAELILDIQEQTLKLFGDP